MAENLNYNPGSGSWAYDNDSSKAAIYGRLYSWPTARKACPQGWHLPSNVEWQTLADYLGGPAVTGGKMKEADTTYWNSPNTGATNESGFSVRCVRDTGATDAGLVHLNSMKNLKKLDLSKTMVTKTGIAELQKALPNLTIE